MLDSIKPVIHKTMVNNEDPMDVKMDSADWKEELSLFEMLDLRTAANEDKYTESVDSNGNLKIQRFSALDSNREIQSLSITYRNNEIELIEAFLKKRTFVVDRDTRMSYQPGKGYGIQLDENYIWSKPHTKEIFVELEPNGFLKK
ncbi:MAG: hypothetical protein KG003_01120 [Bacteroidetes bacterium]|nr:hypothetical protein [Bacteroidota bacterium]